MLEVMTTSMDVLLFVLFLLLGVSGGLILFDILRKRQGRRSYAQTMLATKREDDALLALKERERVRKDTDAERVQKFLKRGECPDCHSTKFRAGPSGGLSQNVKCMCGSEYNVAQFNGEVIFAERISPPGGHRK
jgi:hypothetical protein